MGGTATWHIGLQHPGLWSVVSPGRGSRRRSSTRRSRSRCPNGRKRCCTCTTRSTTRQCRNVPVLAYTGDKDPKAVPQHAADVAAAKAGRRCGSSSGRTRSTSTSRSALAEILRVMSEQQRPDAADGRIRDVHARFPECKWVRLTALACTGDGRDPAAGRPTGRLEFARGTSGARSSPGRPGQGAAAARRGRAGGRVGVRRYIATPARNDGGRPLAAGGRRRRSRESRRRRGRAVSGPIDDALFGPVLAVTGTGTPWTPLGEMDRPGTPAQPRGLGPVLPRPPAREDGPGGLRRTTRPITTSTCSATRARTPCWRGMLPRLPIKWTRTRSPSTARRFRRRRTCRCSSSQTPRQRPRTS